MLYLFLALIILVLASLVVAVCFAIAHLKEIISILMPANTKQSKPAIAERYEDPELKFIADVLKYNGEPPKEY